MRLTKMPARLEPDTNIAPCSCLLCRALAASEHADRARRLAKQKLGRAAAAVLSLVDTPATERSPSQPR